jgi:tRNA pseudouridine55 synthase
MGSHDVVNRVRRIFDERRVGHTGTLDPTAQGAMLLCVGPATRLSPYLTSQEKSYRFTVSFGCSTDTDDASGRVLQSAPVPDELSDPFFAQGFVQSLVGAHDQVPPAYSAVKVGGVRSYAAARNDAALELAPRRVEVYEAVLRGIGHCPSGLLEWDIEARVSKGTYIRSLARDMGESLGTPAHISRLVRTASGHLALDDCCTLDALEAQGLNAALDPVALLGCRLLFLTEAEWGDAANGSPLKAEGRTLFGFLRGPGTKEKGIRADGIAESEEAMEAGELFSVVVGIALRGLYRFDQHIRLLRPQCIFSTGVIRGFDPEGR